MALRLGSLFFSAELILLCVAIAIGWLIARLTRAKQAPSSPDAPSTHPRAEPGLTVSLLWNALFVALAVARLSFVWQHHENYLPAPLSIVDIRDGGWAGLWGLAAAWLYLLIVSAQARHRARARTLLLSLALASSFWLSGRFFILPPPSQLPAVLTHITPLQLNGVATSLNVYRGKPTVVNLWASWCPPCRREMPVFAQAQTAHPDMHFVFLNQGESIDAVKTYVNRYAPSLHNVLLDTGAEFSKALSQSGLPATLFIDAQGQLRGLRIGELSTATLAEQIALLRAGKG